MNARRTEHRSSHQREDDCLCLLQWVSRHREEPQTYESLSDATGIPLTMVWRLITEVEEDPYTSSMTRAAYKYRFEWQLVNEKGKIIDAVYRGYGEG